MKKQIIGFKLSEPEYNEAALLVSGCFQNGGWCNQPEIDITVNSVAEKNLKKVGVLDLWFDPVYAVIEQSKPQLEIGEWYIHKTDRGCTLAYFQGMNKPTYGIAHFGDWINPVQWFEHNVFEENFGKNGQFLTLATEKEIITELDKIRVKLGLVEGVIVNPPCEKWSQNLRLRTFEHEKEAGFGPLHFKPEEKELIYLGILIFKDGKWAEIVKTTEVKLNEQCTATIRNGRVELAGYEFDFRAIKKLQKAVRRYQVQSKINLK